MTAAVVPMRILLVTAVLGLSGNAAAAVEPDTEQLAATLRTLLLANLPDPLVKTDRGWGAQKEIVVGLKWHGLKPETQKSPRNDGHWQRARIVAVDPAKSLALGLKDLKYPEPGKATVTAMLGLDVRLKFEQQLWNRGHRLYAGETRATCRAALALECEVTNRIEPKPGAVLPDVVLRIRVTDAKLFYADLVCEHTAGLDGEAAKKLGELVHDFLAKAKPQVERDLLARANAAVVKAADSKEVRISFDKLLSGRPPSVTRQK